MKARATGSVIDALDPGTIADVLLPSLEVGAQNRLGTAAVAAWEDIAAARQAEDDAVAELESAIVRGYENS